MKHSKQQLNWAARAFALLVLFVFGGMGQRAFAQNSGPADGYYRFVSASTTDNTAVPQPGKSVTLCNVTNS